MRIYRMTATFGKLEHETLTLAPGLNVIYAPNEWGKSTWCAFLVAMLYGMDTRAKTTKTALADKERYAPWSGTPMAGRMDLCWNGRDITIERRTKGRVPLGEFKAYETETGIAIPELTAANCGQTLLGVEQSVFRRAGFVRLSDLPVTTDDNLRRRLNALVTTGDESGDGERLARELRDLRNRCRYNRSGLIPQAEGERDALENKISELEALETQSHRLKLRLGEVKTWQRQLRNHQDALAYAAAEADADRVAQARDAHDRAAKQLEALENRCANQPPREEAEKKLQQLREFSEQWNAAQLQAQRLPAPPEEPKAPKCFENMTIVQAEEMLSEDLRRHALLTTRKPWLVWLLLGAAFLLVGLAGLVLYTQWAGGVLAAAGLVLLVLGLRKRSRWNAEAEVLAERYGSRNREDWLSMQEVFAAERKAYEKQLLAHGEACRETEARMARLETQRASLCGGQTPEKVMETWQQILRRWEEYHAACWELQRMAQHLQTLQAMAKPAPPPEMEDELAYTETETARLLAEAIQEQQRLQNRLGQYQGRMEALGDPKALEKQLDAVNARLKKLEQTYAALTIALDTLNDAKLELQRRFAPRITKRAQALLGELTGGRYDRLAMGADFSLRAGAGQEDTLHDSLWRSDGTVDQLYLALRLAVAEELTPNAPLVLDDALARFDEDRMKAALEILKNQAQTKQVILFSCQEREQNAVK